jgi:hypothetical protein
MRVPLTYSLLSLALSVPCLFARVQERVRNSHRLNRRTHLVHPYQACPRKYRSDRRCESGRTALSRTRITPPVQLGQRAPQERLPRHARK